MLDSRTSRVGILQLILILSINSAILNPNVLDPLMFTETITGLPNIAKPIATTEINGITVEKYVITMEKVTQKILPGNFPNTTIYAYSTDTNAGKIASFPGPMIMARKLTPIQVTWVNNIKGPHMLPVDFNEPFIDDPLFRQEVPTVPHVHGIVTSALSDGLPGHYWTASGARSPSYQTEQPCKKNEAVYSYPNQQDPGLFWFHDHTYGITRLNVYAGLVGLYEIADPNPRFNFAQKNIFDYYGENLTRLYFAIADRTFTTDGQLYYPNESESPDYSSWVPQFYGNTITVNGKVWPKLNLSKKVYRFVLLNGCNSRYLNIFFLSQQQKIPFLLLRLEGDYFEKPVEVMEFLMSPSARLEIIVDFSRINGDVLLKNNAAAPYPDGEIENLIDKYTGTIMKISLNLPSDNMQSQKDLKLIKRKVNLIKQGSLLLKKNYNFPAFSQGERVFEVLSEVQSEDQSLSAMFISGMSMAAGKNCEGAMFELGKVYDFEIINLTPDTHPIHFHLVNFQKIMSYPINVDNYKNNWYHANGGPPPKGGYSKMPIKMDPRGYQSGDNIMPQPHELVFRDVIDVQPEMVTVLRMRFSHNNGQPFGINVSGSRFVWHCHILEHEDNQMMKYFCLK